MRSREALEGAIRRARKYSPAFIVEKFLADTFVYRATVVDFDQVACAQQIPAHVRGDGKHAISELIKIKNSDPRRGEPNKKGFILSKLIVNDVTNNLLQKRGYAPSTIPRKGEIVYIQEDPFLKLGGDLIEVTSTVHPRNTRLFREVAKWFDVRLVGIDVVAEDLSRPWEAQPCAILELNSLPCIEMHHFPSFGKPQNVAGAIMDMMLKYYT